MLQADRSGAVLTLRLDRAERRNALDDALIERLGQSLAEAAVDEAVHVVVLGTADPAAFSAGMDIKSPDRRATTRALLDLQWALETHPKPVIAELQGHVIGGGAELALSADLRVASPTAEFRFPASGYGIVQGTWHLASAVGEARAKELVLTGRTVGAEEALRIGLVHEVAADVRARAAELAQQLAARNQRSLREIKRLFAAAPARTLRERFDAERELIDELIGDADL